jgi:protein-tyrosine phosphatase
VTEPPVPWDVELARLDPLDIAGRVRIRGRGGTVLQRGRGGGVVPLMSWIGTERIAIGSVPPTGLLEDLARQGVTHVVNCRPWLVVRMHGDLAAERAAFGRGQVAHAPMWDLGRRQRARWWADAACFAARVLDDQPQARVLIHCSAGRRRSAILAYAVLRLRGRTADEAASLVLRYRPGAQMVPAYVQSVERWLARDRAALR